jgi:hypothetical protein
MEQKKSDWIPSIQAGVSIGLKPSTAPLQPCSSADGFCTSSSAMTILLTDSGGTNHPLAGVDGSLLRGKILVSHPLPAAEIAQEP